MDIVIVIILVLAAILGFKKGFVAQVVGILSLLVGVWCSFKLSGWLAELVKGWFDTSISIGTFKVAAFIIILVVVVVLGHLLCHVLEGVVKLTMLGWLNRLLGTLFSLLQALLIMSIIIYLFTYLNQSLHFIPQSTLDKCYSYRFLEHFATVVFPYLRTLF
jgi:Uncharacterized membrane protein, required for colicin V production